MNQPSSSELGTPKDQEKRVKLISKIALSLGGLGIAVGLGLAFSTDTIPQSDNITPVAVGTLLFAAGTAAVVLKGMPALESFIPGSIQDKNSKPQ